MPVIMKDKLTATLFHQLCEIHLDTVENLGTFTFILKGKTKCLIGDDEIELKQGDYIVIQPGVPNNTVAEILEDVSGLTIKVPSDPTAKKIVG